MAGTCCIRDCERPAARGEFCWAHIKRRQRGQRLGAEIRELNYDTPMGRLMEAAIILADCKPSDDIAWARARDRLRKAAVDYVEAVRGKCPPPVDTSASG